MKDVAQNREALARLEPDDVEAYLRNTGWAVSGQEPGRVSYWRRVHKPSGETFEVVCLRNKSFGDYTQRMAEMLDAVSVMEDRPTSDVYVSMTQAAFDVAELQIVRNDAKDGDIPLKVGAAAFQGAMKLYAAAAAAVEEPKPYYGALLSGKVNKFLSESVRLGQTRRGSYVINIATRLPPSARQADLGGDLRGPDPYERQVMLRLATALDAARAAAVTKAEASFRAAVAQGVSADLCDAVGKLAEGDAFQELNLNLRWSRLRPVPRGVPTKLSFSSKLVRNLREGAAHLRFKEPLTAFPLMGMVVRLERYPEEKAGTVGILGFVTSEAENVSVSLSEEDYHQATTAHDEGRVVVCEGELKRTGRGYALLQPRKFRVLPKEYGSAPSTPAVAAEKVHYEHGIARDSPVQAVAEATPIYAPRPKEPKKKTTAKPPRRKKLT